MMIKENDSYQDVTRTKNLKSLTCTLLQKSYYFSSPIEEELNTQNIILLFDSHRFKLKFRTGAKSFEVT
jgi:hypothetical protein